MSSNERPLNRFILLAVISLFGLLLVEEVQNA
jgi:hypothetical protein